jgi:hypothetical protein
MAIVERSKPAVLSPDLLGTSFVFRTAEVLGPAVGKPPYEGQQLTVVGFRRRLKNAVMVQDANGNCSLMPLDMVEKALSLQALQASREGIHSLSTEEHER